MKTITINLPDTIDVDNEEAVLAIATRLYEKGKLTLGQAAELAGLSKEGLMVILGNYGISVFHHPSTDLDRDVDNARGHNR